MGEEIRYSLELNKFLKYSIWALPVLSAIIFIIFLIYADIDNTKLLFALPFFGFAFWNWSKYFKRPVRIGVFKDYANLYNILSKETMIKFSDIKSIESDRSKALIIRTKSDKILGINGFDEFSRFVEDVRITNKDLLVKGL